MELLRGSERPVIIAGSGVWWSSCEGDLQSFIEHTSLPLYTITMARGAVPDAHPLNMGYADPAMNKAIHTAFREADLFLILGKRLDYRLALGGTRLFPAEAKFIQVDLHPQELGMNRKLDWEFAPTQARLSARFKPQPARGRGRPGRGSIAYANSGANGTPAWLRWPKPRALRCTLRHSTVS